MDFGDARVLITGGLGFIGSNLARRLVAMGADVSLVDSLIPDYGGSLFNVDGIQDQVRVNISDVRDMHSMKYLVQGQDFLFNLAGQTSHVDSMVDPYTDLDINCRAQLSILEACRHFNPTAKVVFASTRQVYGKPQYLPVDEAHPIRPVDVNGINKIAGERYHVLYHDVYGIRTSVLRLTNTYGPRMRAKDARQTFLGIWIRNLLEGKPIQVFGDGMQIRDYNYVDDVVDALLLVADNDAADGRVFNVGSPEHFTLLETAELMIEINGSGCLDLVPFPPERKSIDIGDYFGDYKELESRIGWSPKVSLAEGLAQTLDFYRSFWANYWEPINASA